MSKTLAVQFTHFLTGKPITVFDHKMVGAMIWGTCNAPGLKTDVETVFLVIDKCPVPIPVTETTEQVIELLDKLKTKETT